MDVSEILEGLNAEQREAVSHHERIVRVIAGAGSGKTRVLVQRMLWLMKVEGLPAQALLALTFTNKAAREMQQRLEVGVQSRLPDLWMGTFHGICYRILRRHAEKMGWIKDFVVMDSEDQLSFIRRLMRDNLWSDDTISAQDLRNYINKQKEQGLRANAVVVKSAQAVVMRDFYQQYEYRSKEQGRMDFAELQLLTVELLQSHDNVRESFRRRFEAILVDEFQDTNGLQMQLIELLLSPSSRLFVVGDDDQSIYSWRGARVENMLELEQRFPQKVATVRLEQNYRSTQTILEAANALIAENTQRLGKRLWSEGNAGEKIVVYPAYNEYDEAEYVAAQVLLILEQGGNYRDCAVLYRSNAISRVFEKVFTGHQIPYRVYGGLRFFERAEIKDALAYLRMALQPHDDNAFERIVNVPARAIGNKTVEDLRSLTQQGNLSFWQLLEDEALLRRHIATRAVNALLQFRSLILHLRDALAAQNTLKEAMEILLKDSGLNAMYEQSKKEDALSRLENLQELVSAAAYADARYQGTSVPIGERIEQFLADAALDAGDNEAEEDGNAVQLMTMHSAKGLEFPQVFVVACEEDIFPHYHSLNDKKSLEEERRLAYVAITRAMQKLTISFAQRRRFQGNEKYPEPSRYLGEIPEHLLHAVRPLVFHKAMPWRHETEIQHKTQSSGEGQTFQIGEDVLHPSFGQGTITHLEGQGEHSRALVRFTDKQEKWLVLAYAKLSKI